MIKIRSSPNGVEMHNLKNVLMAEGIECEVRGEYRRSAVGELPVNECWVELWLVDDTQQAEAERILSAETSWTDWVCANCGETIEGQFTQCWNCLTERESDEPES